MPLLIVQESDDTCALACLRMIMSDFGIDVSEQALASKVDVQAGGIDIEELQRLAEQFGLHATVVRLVLCQH